MNKNESVIEQSKKSRWYRNWFSISSVIAISGLGLYFFQKEDTPNTDKQPSALYTVKKGNIQISVEGEGKIMNPNIVNLSFFINGTLDEILVEEGQKVTTGDILAKLDKRDYEFNLKDSQSQVRIVQANIKAKKSEITDDDIRIAKNDILISQQNLRNAENDYQQTLDQALVLGSLKLETTLSEIRKALENIDDILGVDKNRSKYSNVATTFNNSILKNRAINAYKDSKREWDTLWYDYYKKSPLEKTDISSFLWQTKNLAINVQNTLETTLRLFSTSTSNNAASVSNINEAENMIKNVLSTINGEINDLTSSRQKIENAYLAQQNGLNNMENSLKTSQIKLENTSLNLDQKNTSKEASLSVLYAQLEQSLIKVEKTKYNLDLTTLKAPIDGEIIVVNGNPGEAVKVDSTSSENALIRILSDANFTTEIYVEEVEIANLKVGQKAIITMDAIEDLILEGNISYIASVATIDNNNITTYLVRVDIPNTKEASIKEGMSTYTEFILQKAEDVLIIPNSAIRKGQVQLENGQFISVKTGITDGITTEIKNGLIVGQKIFQIPQTQQEGTTNSTTPKTEKDVTEDRMQLIESMLKKQDILPEGWEKMSTEEKQESLQTLRESGVFQGLNGSSERGMGGGR
ncbi:HlyD family efflux transporter periplasmic adaptor subunit [Candidatus Gracilibacteria bacterium]|nr:HlyD family efflux transporter periplasmic adaptor subunit [Candidatus Gracilibacteria bacterium]